MSAVDGLIDTAPSDQFDVPLNVSEKGKLGAPGRVVPLPAAAWSGLATLAGGALVTGYRKARRQMA